MIEAFITLYMIVHAVMMIKASDPFGVWSYLLGYLNGFTG